MRIPEPLSSEIPIILTIKNLFIFFLFFGINSSLNCQSSFYLGSMPGVNINKDLKQDWSLNFSIESRQNLKSWEDGNSSDLMFDYELTDLSLITAKKVGLNSKLAAGYLIRLEGSQVGHRFIQQFSTVRKYSTFRMGHRFSTDQTFGENEDTEWRFRYRINAELPLNGDSADSGEFYMKLNNEYLNKFQRGDYDLEFRLSPYLGYIFEDTNKIELGLDYRIDGFLDSAAENDFWIRINWYLKI